MFGLMTRKTINATTSGKEIGMTTMTTKNALIESLAQVEALESLGDNITAAKSELAGLYKQIDARRTEVLTLESRAGESDKIIKKAVAERLRILADVPSEVSRRERCLQGLWAMAYPLQRGPQYLASSGWRVAGYGRYAHTDHPTVASYDLTTALLVQIKEELKAG